MAATTKAELQDIMRTEYDRLQMLIDDLPAEDALQPDDDGISIKDIVAHRAHWIDLFLGWHADGLAGRDVHFPAPGYKWSDLKRYNADLRVAQADLRWAAAKSALRDAHDRLAAFVAAQSEGELYGGPMPGAKNAWTTGRWAEAAGPSHFRSAAKYVRARRRARQAT